MYCSLAVENASCLVIELVLAELIRVLLLSFLVDIYAMTTLLDERHLAVFFNNMADNSQTSFTVSLFS